MVQTWLAVLNRVSHFVDNTEDIVLRKKSLSLDFAEDYSKIYTWQV